MPIRLWSTVVTQLQSPLSARGRSKRRDGASTVTAMTSLLDSLRLTHFSASRPGSFQRLEERHQVVDLLFGQVVVGHARALIGPHRLHGRWILYPPLQVLRCDLEHVA